MLGASLLGHDFNMVAIVLTVRSATLQSSRQNSGEFGKKKAQDSGIPTHCAFRTVEL
jgi:hypothetical protein